MQYSLIKVGDRSVPCYYGMVAIAAIEARGIDIGEALSSIRSGKLVFYNGLAITYEGIKEGHRKANKTFELEESDVAEWIENDFSIISKCLEVLATSNFMQKLVKAGTDSETADADGDKKKSNRSRELMKSSK